MGASDFIFLSMIKYGNLDILTGIKNNTPEI